jgi:hypothetical protein
MVNIKIFYYLKISYLFFEACGSLRTLTTIYLTFSVVMFPALFCCGFGLGVLAVLLLGKNA